LGQNTTHERIGQSAISSTEEAQRGVRITLVGDVATAYFQLLQHDRELAIQKEAAKAYKHSYEIFDERLKSGSASRLEPARDAATPPVGLALRARFNPNLEQSWFGALMEIINNVTMLSIILTGAALIREREHGTIEHLLVMPVTPLEIMLGKVWAMGLVVTAAAVLALLVVVEGVLRVPIEGSVPLFVAGAVFFIIALNRFRRTISQMV
jgi:ABC-type multidrug transport system permease subunit